MATWAVLAAFASGVAWSGLDIARKSLARDLSPAVIAAALCAGPTVLFGPWAAFDSPSIPTIAYLRPGILSMLLAVTTHLLIIESVRRSEFSRTIPLLSLTPVATALSGALVLGEHPSATQWAGMLLIFGGALGLGLARVGRGPSILRFDKGGLLMLLAALSISAAAPFDKLAVAASSTPVHGSIQSFGAGLLLLGFLALRGELGQIGRAVSKRPGLAGAVVLAFAALGLQFVAYGGAMVGAVEAIKRVVGLAASLVAGSLVFGERITIGKLTTVGAMTVGIVLLLR